MKTVNKKSVQAGTKSVVSAIATPLHIGLQVTTNLLYTLGQAATNSVADAEGYIVEKIDGTPREETAGKRFEFTQSKMLAAAIEADKIKQRMKSKLTSAKVVIDDSIIQIKEAIKPGQDANDIEEMTLDFRIAKLRSDRDKIQSKKKLTSEDNKAINAINREIGKLNKELPKVSPAVAFA